MSTRSTDIGKVAHAVSTTRITHAPGGQQSFNLFQDQSQNVVAQPTRRARAPPGGSSSKDNFLAHPEIENAPPSRNLATKPSSEASGTEVAKKDTKVTVAPGGNSSLSLAHEEFVPTQAPHAAQVSQTMKSNIFDDESEPVATRFSTRIHTAPGGKSAMGSVLNHEHGEMLPVKKKADPQQKSNIFSEEPVQSKSSTKRILAPGGQSNITFAPENNSENEQQQPQHSFHTARINQSKNLFDLSPPEKSRRPVNPFKNKSSNVTNLTPKVESRTLPRTGKALEESRLKEEPKPVCWARYATHNKMMQSSIFSSEAPADEPKRTSVRLSHQPAGGASSNIFS